MKITEITYSRGQTLQLRQFEPVNVHFSMKAEVVQGESIEECYKAIKELVDQEVAVQTEMLQGNSGKIVREAAKKVADPF